MKVSKETHTLLEINNHSMAPIRHKTIAAPNNLELLELAKKYETPVIFGSDAHFSTMIADYSNIMPLVEKQSFLKSWYSTVSQRSSWLISSLHQRNRKYSFYIFICTTMIIEDIIKYNEQFESIPSVLTLSYQGCQSAWLYHRFPDRQTDRSEIDVSFLIGQVITPHDRSGSYQLMKTCFLHIL